MSAQKGGATKSSAATAAAEDGKELGKQQAEPLVEEDDEFEEFEAEGEWEISSRLYIHCIPISEKGNVLDIHVRV